VLLADRARGLRWSPGLRGLFVWGRYAYGTFMQYVLLTLYPRRGFRRALSPRRGPSVRPLRLAPWASGVAPRLIRTARARATILQQSPKCENTDFCISCPATWRRSKKLKFANKNAKHGSHMLGSSPKWARPVRTDSRWYCPSGSVCRQSLDHDLDGCREGSILCEASQLVM